MPDHTAQIGKKVFWTALDPDKFYLVEALGREPFHGKFDGFGQCENCPVEETGIHIVLKLLQEDTSEHISVGIGTRFYEIPA